MPSRLIFLYCFAGVYGKDLVLNLGPNDYNYHPLEVKTLSKDNVEPTKNGPVLFPNDGPPPPKTPLIVTSRPLTESIARSELNPETHQQPTPQYHDKGRINQLRFLKDKRPKIGIIHARKFTDPHIQDNGGLGVGRYYEADGRSEDNDQSPLVLINHVSGKPLYDYDPRNPQAKVFVDRKDLKFKDEEYRLRLPGIYKVIGQRPLERSRFKVKGEKVYAVNSGEAGNNIHNDDENANYAFSYKVKDQKTGDDFSHTQRSSGSATNGEYRVRLPDGRMQIVSYTADENGYKADVRYDNPDVRYNKPDVRYDKADASGSNPRVKDHHHDYFNNFLDYNQVHYDDYTSPSQNGHSDTYQIYGNKDILYTNTDNVRTEKVDESIFNYPDQKKADNQADHTDDDYEIDYDDEGEYDAHKGKFGELCKHKNPYLRVIMVPNNKEPRVTTLSPLIEGLKGLFSAITPETNIPIEHSVPSTTAKPTHQQRINTEEEENVVHIGGKSLYTNVQTALPFLRKFTQYQQQIPITTQSEPTPRNYPVNYTPYYIFPTTTKPGPTRHNPYYVFPTTTTTIPTTKATNTPYYIFPNVKPFHQSYTTINPHHEEEPPHHSPVDQDELLNLYQRVPTTTDSHQRVPTTTSQPFQSFPTTTEQYQRYPTQTPQFERVSTILHPRPTIASIVSNLGPIKNIDFSNGKPTLTTSFIDKINKYLSY